MDVIARPAVLVLLLLLTGPPTADAGTLRMEFSDGYVTISAADVPLRQVLNEWARLGQTRVVNGEKVGGPLVTLELAHVPEKQALETLLRNVPGYLAAPRPTAIPGGSQFDRIVVMAGTVNPPAPAAAPPPPSPPPSQPAQMPADVDDQDQPVDGSEPNGAGEPEQPEQAPQQTPQAMPQPGVQPMPQPGIQPMPPNPNPQGQNEQDGERPAGPAPVPAAGAIVAPRPGQLPVPPPKPPGQ
jgi:hypothetical protein